MTDSFQIFGEADSTATLPVLAIPTGYFEDYLLTSSNLEETLVIVAFFALRSQLGSPQWIPEDAIMSYEALMTALTPTTGSQTASARVLRALNRAVRRGALIRRWTEDNDRRATWYEAPTDNVRPDEDSATVRADTPSAHDDAGLPMIVSAPAVFAAYEHHIAVLTPLVADQIQQAVERYPATWILEAIRESARANRRSWRYIQRVLQQWADSGRAIQEPGEPTNETDQRSRAESLDTDQYREGRHLERARKIQL